MKVILVIAMMLAGENEPTVVKAEMPSMLECFQTGWKVVNQAMPENMIYFSATCEWQAGTPS